MDTRSAGTDMRADMERVTQVQTQCKDLGKVIDRLQEVVSQLSAVFQPVLARVGDEASLAAEPVAQTSLAPLAQQILELEQRITTATQRLVDLVKRCEA